MRARGDGYHQNHMINKKITRRTKATLMEKVMTAQSVRPMNARMFQISQNGNQSGDVRSFAVLMCVQRSVQTYEIISSQATLRGNPREEARYSRIPSRHRVYSLPIVRASY